MLHLVHDRVTTSVTRVVRKSVVSRCGDKSGKSTFLLFPDILFPKTENKAGCFLWRNSNPVVNYSPIQIYRADNAVGVTERKKTKKTEVRHNIRLGMCNGRTLNQGGKRENLTK